MLVHKFIRSWHRLRAVLYFIGRRATYCKQLTPDTCPSAVNQAELGLYNCLVRTMNVNPGRFYSVREAESSTCNYANNTSINGLFYEYSIHFGFIVIINWQNRSCLLFF